MKDSIKLNGFLNYLEVPKLILLQTKFQNLNYPEPSLLNSQSFSPQFFSQPLINVSKNKFLRILVFQSIHFGAKI